MTLQDSQSTLSPYPVSHTCPLPSGKPSPSPQVDFKALAVDALTALITEPAPPPASAASPSAASPSAASPSIASPSVASNSAASDSAASPSATSSPSTASHTSAHILTSLRQSPPPPHFSSIKHPAPEWSMCRASLHSVPNSHSTDRLNLSTASSSPSLIGRDASSPSSQVSPVHVSSSTHPNPTLPGILKLSTLFYDPSLPDELPPLQICSPLSDLSNGPQSLPPLSVQLGPLPPLSVQLGPLHGSSTGSTALPNPFLRTSKPPIASSFPRSPGYPVGHHHPLESTRPSPPIYPYYEPNSPLSSSTLKGNAWIIPPHDFQRPRGRTKVRCAVYPVNIPSIEMADRFETSATATAMTTSPADPSAIDGITAAQFQYYTCTFPGCGGLAFQTQYLLNSHTTVHSSARPYYCPVPGCPRADGGQGFKRKNEMIRHGLVHQSPGYICPFCPDREHKYPRPDNLQRHVRVHHPDRDMQDPTLRCILLQRLEGPRSRRKSVTPEPLPEPPFEPIFYAPPNRSRRK